ncbi:MAG: carboxymuconolactone decarboxylase family protein [Actinomycetes bacterium]
MPSNPPSIALPTDDEIRPDVLDRLKTMPPLNIIRALARTPECFGPWLDFVAGIYAMDFDPRLREIALCRYGNIANSPYELEQHTALARGRGVTDAELTAIASEHPVTTLDDDGNLICRVVDEFEGTATLGDDTLAVLLGRFEESTVMTLLVTLGHYSCVVRVVNAARVPLEGTSPLAGRGSPTG